MSSRTYVKSNPASTVAVVGIGLAALYLLTRSRGEAPGGSVFEKVTERISGGVSDSASNILAGVGKMPGDIILGTGEQTVKKSEQSVSQTVFGDQPRTNVFAYLATGSKKGQVFAQPVTYAQFIEAQPLAFRGAAATGNIITGDRAASYGSLVAAETKKGISAAGRDPSTFAEKSAFSQTLIGLGQAFTVPFGGGGAAGWGANIRSWFG